MGGRRILPLTQSGIIAELLRNRRGMGAALAAAEVPVPFTETLTVASNGQTAFTLSYLPIDDVDFSSVRVFLREQRLVEGTDYTVDYDTGALTLTGTRRTAYATPAPADEVTVDYWTNGERIAQVLPPDAGYAELVIADGPLFYFRLGEATVSSGATAADSSGHSRDGLFSGTTLSSVASLLTSDTGDNAIDSAGTISDGVELAYASWMNVTQASWEFWISSTDADGGRIFARESPSYVWSIQGGAGSPIYFLASATTIATSTSTDYFDGNPHHVVITYDGTTVRFYKDGVADGSTAWAGPLPTATNSAITLLHAVGTNVNASLIVGTLDEVAMYDYALTATQVGTHYTAGTS